MTAADKGLLAAFAGLGATAAGIPTVLPAVVKELGTGVLEAVPALFGEPSWWCAREIALAWMRSSLFQGAIPSARHGT